MPLPPKYKPVTHVLFDMDGLLLNTEELYTTAFQNYVAQFGKDYTYDLKLKLMGSQAHETAETIIQELDLPVTIETFFIETQKQFERLFPNCKLMPGAFRLIRHLCNQDIPIGLATSSTRQSYELKIKKCHEQFMDLIPYKTFGSDPEVKRGKPYPDIFLVAAMKFPDNPPPAEDIPIGLATSSTRQSYELKIKKCHEKFMDLIPYKTFGSDPDVKRGKPCPDIFLVAASKFPDNPPPAEVLVFEDSINGVKAAIAAGMQVVMVPDPQLDRRLTREATVVIDSLEHFRPEEFGLPPFLDDIEVEEIPARSSSSVSSVDRN